MTAYTFAPQNTNFDENWGDPTIWAGGVVPNAPDADVNLQVVYSGSDVQSYEVMVNSGSSYSIRSLVAMDYLSVAGALAISQSFSLPHQGELLLNGGTVSAGSMVIDGTDVQGSGQLNVAGALILNQSSSGTSSINGSNISVNAGSLTNSGQLVANANLSITVSPGGFTNLSSGVLTGGTYVARTDSSGNPGVLSLNVGQPITVDAADIVLYGAGSTIQTYNSTSAQYAPLQSTLQTIASNGVLELDSGVVYQTGSLDDAGLIQMGGGTLSASNLLIDKGGVLDNSGTVNGAITNNGSIDIGVLGSGGDYLDPLYGQTLVVNGSITGSGDIVVDAELGQGRYSEYVATGTLELNGSSDENIVLSEGAGSIYLSQPQSFTGSISVPTAFAYYNPYAQQSYEASANLILEGVSYSSVTSYAYSGDSNGGTLTVQTTQGTYTYKYVGDFQTSDFTLSAAPQTLSSQPPSLLIALTPPRTPPTISGTMASQGVPAAEPDRPFANVAVGANNADDTLQVTVALSSPANGSLSLSIAQPSSVTSASYNATTGVYTIDGTAAGVTQAIDALLFTPNASGIAAGQSQTTTFTISASDVTTQSAATVDSTSSVTAYQGVSFNGGANAPLVLGTPGNDTLASSTAGAFLYGAGGQDTLTLGAANETVELNAPGVYGAWTSGQGLDIINGFQSGVDHLAFDMSVFGVTPGAYQFMSGPGATPTTASPTFYFDTKTDYLWFDPDGTGAAAADLVAFLPGLSSMSASDLTPAQVSFATGASVVNTTPGSTTYGEGQNETLWATGVNETLVGGAYRGQYIAEAKSDTIVAGNGGAFIAGIGGDDQIYGGTSGADAFYFNSPKAGVDTIFNFSEANGDQIDLQGSAFAAPAGFQFTDGVGFVQGPGAHALAATATLAYDTTTGYLWFDPDGTGPAGRSLLAFLPGTPSLHAADFKVV